jgi:hypothetical protein
MSETMEQLASALGCEIVPETLPVKQSSETCPVHNFRFVSYPRDAGSDDLNFVMKCPLRVCFHGVVKPRAND